MSAVERQRGDVSVARDAALDGRYRLDQVRGERELADGRRATLWRADDEALGRRVAILVVAGGRVADRKSLLAAATRASRVGDGRLVRVLDVGTGHDEHGTPAAWVATEWVDGPTLTAVLRRAPMAVDEAVELVQACAEALAVAARQGCRHGRLHPDQVLLSDSGLPRVTGLEVAACLAGDAEVGDRDDVRGLGGLLYAAVTGRFPLHGWTGLPSAAGSGATSSAPRQLRPDLPRDVDELTVRALTGELASPKAVAQALAALPRARGDRQSRAARPVAPVLRRWAWRVVPPVLIVTVAALGWSFGSDLGRVPTTARAVHPALPPTQAGTPGAALRLVWGRTPPAVTSFDPEGDGQENEDTVALAVDRDPSTSWTTTTYRGNGQFGGLKPGVGLLLDLGRRRTVRLAELALSAPGASVELRAGDSPPVQATDLTLVTVRERAPAQLRLTLRAPTTARYWLVWFTTVPPATGGFRVGVAEVALLG